MRTSRTTFMKRFLVIIFLLLGAMPALTADTAHAAAVDVYLYAGATAKAMPDGTVVPMWGFALEPDGVFTTLEGTLEAPGPRIAVAAGDTLNIHLYNNLAEPVSLMIPGQAPQVASMSPTWTDGTSGPRGSDLTKRVRSFTSETAPGAVQTYSWTGVRPGTYLYQSGTHPAVQVQMGLYGALTVNAAPGLAYPSTGAYASEALLLYSEIDPALHNAVAGGTYGTAMTSTIDYKPKYFLVNGMPFPVNSAIAVGNPAGPVLIRFLNAGLKTHVPTIENAGYMSIIAEDGKAYPYARSQYSVLLPAGKTADALWTPSSAGYVALYDRRLYLTNDSASPGGMVSYLGVASPTQHELSVVGVGTGTVTSVSVPGGISCGTDCSEIYNGGTSVTLTARADEGSIFLGWLGDGCWGTGDCTVTIDADRKVVAVFLKPFLPWLLQQLAR